MNSKVNNWAVELESQNITFEYIPGIRNTLADTLSRLIDIDENIRLQPEEEGKEFGYFPFEELPPAQTQMVETNINRRNRNAKHPPHRPHRNQHRGRAPTKGQKISETTRE